jgi:hypothetical protein
MIASDRVMNDRWLPKAFGGTLLLTAVGLFFSGGIDAPTRLQPRTLQSAEISLLLPGLSPLLAGGCLWWVAARADRRNGAAVQISIAVAIGALITACLPSNGRGGCAEPGDAIRCLFDNRTQWRLDAVW